MTEVKFYLLNNINRLNKITSVIQKHNFQGIIPDNRDMAELFRTLFQNPFTPQNVTEPEEGIPFQDVRDHMQEIYVLSAEDWENVERVLLWF